MLIGNLTRDPELRYTPGGMAVVSFGMATNRVWVTKQGERKEDAQFHRIVAWNKLAELCSQLLGKGRRVYVEGRIQYREFTDQEGQRKQISEVVIDDMMILDNKGFASNNNREEQNVDLAAPVEPSLVAGGEIGDITIPDDLGEPMPSVVEPIAETPTEEGTGEKKPEDKSDEMPF
jgi:single-strand DNA-binding protein